MKDFIQDSVFFGVLITLLSYFLGAMLKRRFKSPLLNPLLVSIVLIIGFLLATDVSYDSYAAGSQYISYLLTPATVCLALPLYQQWQLLKQNFIAVMAGIVAGALTSMLTVLALALLLHFDHQAYVTFLPKSITTAIGIGVSEELGGYVSVTVVVIVVTGVLGNIIAEQALKLMRITDPIAKGIAIGSASHAVGTAKAMELGPVEGAMSSLSIVVSGILTVVAASLFANFI